MKLKNLTKKPSFWKILAFLNILSSFVMLFYITKLYSIKDLQTGLMGVFFPLFLNFYLIIEFLILLSGVAIILFKPKWIKALASLALIIQLLMIISLFSPGNFKFSGSEGYGSEKDILSWDSETPLGIAKTDYKAPMIIWQSPVTGYCLIELEAKCRNVSGEVQISAEVTDNVGVKVVRIYADDKFLKEFNNSLYEVTWDSDSVSTGSHTLRVFAEDYAGNTTNNYAKVLVR